MVRISMLKKISRRRQQICLLHRICSLIPPLVDTMIHIDFEGPVQQRIKSADIAGLFSVWRIQNTATVYRIEREYKSGGFGNPDKHPYVWAMALLVDGIWARVHNTREQGISRRQVVNDLEDVDVRRLGEAYYKAPK